MLPRTKINYSHISCFILLLLAIAQFAIAVPYPGYTLYCPNNGRYTYLKNLSNTTVHSWTHSRSGGYSCYLLENGDLIRSAVSSSSSMNGGGAEGIVQKYNWSGTLIWEYTYSTTTYRSHHDICPMPNGNVILIAWESKTAAQAVAAGLSRSSAIWPDHLVEVQPSGSTGGTIVWQWHAWDHLIQAYDASKANYGVIADHPELLNLNCGSSGVGPGGGDWMHVNSVSYNPTLDQITFSSHNLNELYVIDHSTTTAEAATHTGGRWGRGGDFLYRWGNPANYGTTGTQVFDVVHCAWWVPAGLPGAGHILAFNNRSSSSTSMIVEIVPPMDTLGNYTRTTRTAFGPASPVWSYTATGFYSQHLGGNQRLPNGNTMIAEATSGNLFEVDSAGRTVWSYTPGGEIVRVLRYGTEYPGVAILGTEEEVAALPNSVHLLSNYPNPFNSSTKINIKIDKLASVKLSIYNANGELISKLVDGRLIAGDHNFDWNGKNMNGMSVNSGVYFCRLQSGSTVQTRKLVLVK